MIQILRYERYFNKEEERGNSPMNYQNEGVEK